MTRTILPRQSELTPEQIAMHRALLEQQRQFRVEQIAQLRLPAAGPQTGADAEISASLLHGARAALHDIRAALRRIDDGSFGRCVSCDGQVGAARLEILPHAARCLHCSIRPDPPPAPPLAPLGRVPRSEAQAR